MQEQSARVVHGGLDPLAARWIDGHGAAFSRAVAEAPCSGHPEVARRADEFRCLVLTGEGKAFVAGADIAAWISPTTRPISQRPMIQNARAASTLMAISTPVVLRNVYNWSMFIGTLLVGFNDSLRWRSRRSLQSSDALAQPAVRCVGLTPLAAREGG